ncbi:MAG TPA: MarC family protein [Dehalococcoidia bacterium]|nr:MarC family protein [Dehalococcoidia bacterium]
MSVVWEQFILTFIPLFIVIDAIGTLPFVISLGEGMNYKERRRMINIAVLTAVVVGLAFLFFGQFVLTVMGISFASFAVAGGIILLVLSIRHMTTGQMTEDIVKEEVMAMVPIGTPLSAGPATITTLILLAQQYPFYIVLISFLLNIVVLWIIFLLGNWIAGFLGKGGLKAVSRVFSLLLAAIAVSMIFKGLDMAGIISLT